MKVLINENELFIEQVLGWGQRLDKHQCSHIIIHSNKKNHPIYIGGKGKYLAGKIKGWPLYGGESMTFPVRNSADISACAEVPGEYIQYIAVRDS